MRSVQVLSERLTPMMKQLGSLLLALVATFVAWDLVQADPIPVRTELFLRSEAQVDADALQWQVSPHFLTGGFRAFKGVVTCALRTSHSSTATVSTRV